MLPLTREGCRDFRRGDGSDVPSAGIYFIKPTSLFCRSNHPHRLCANMRRAEINDVRSASVARFSRGAVDGALKNASSREVLHAPIFESTAHEHPARAGRLDYAAGSHGDGGDGQESDLSG